MFVNFKRTVREDVEEFITTGKMHRAIELSAQTGQHFNHNQYPMYFVGKLEAKLVLVHLNPKQPDNVADTYEGQFWLPSFDEYFDYHRHFGKRNYGAASAQKQKAQFDAKQIRFLRPFGAIDFVVEQSPADHYTNLEKVIDEKLQLELIPYGSDTFSVHGFNDALLKPHIDRILDVIVECPRDYVLFCGRVFGGVFRRNITATHTFTLQKKDGQPTRNQARFSNLCFQHAGQTITAGLAHSFAQLGIPMKEYGRRCKALYHS